MTTNVYFDSAQVHLINNLDRYFRISTLGHLVKHVMSRTYTSFTLVLDGHTDVGCLHGDPLQMISNHLTNPFQL